MTAAWRASLFRRLIRKSRPGSPADSGDPSIACGPLQSPGLNRTMPSQN